jgi:molybdate transport system ATP-binding protein
LNRHLEIELRHVSLSRSERRVLRDVSWRIRPGERWLLFGANGAGKSQLLKLLAGDVWPTPDGRVRRRYRWRGERFDDPYGIKEQIAYVGAERQDKYERYGWDFPVTDLIGTGIHRTDIPMNPLTVRDQRRISSLLKRFGLESLAKRRFFTLSYGQRRLVLLARALAWRPALLLLDEVFEGLDRERHALVSRWLAVTGRSALPWVIATHRVKDVPSCITHVAVLESGRLKTYRAKSGLAQIAHWKLDSVRPVKRPRNAGGRAKGDLIVKLSHATIYLGEFAVVRNVSMTVRAGEGWVIHGPNGAGKTTLLRTIYGDHGVGKSAIQRVGIEPGVPLEHFKRRVGWVAPNLQSDHPLTLTVSEVMQSGRYASIGLNDPPAPADRACARLALEIFGLQPLERRTIRELSYGQMRRVLFARAWVRRPRLLLLDEPFAGVDQATRTVLRQDVERALGEGIAVIMSTHHEDEWPHGLTHELELKEGRVIYCGAPRR